MSVTTPQLPRPERIQSHILKALQRYWSGKSELIADLPIQSVAAAPKIQCPPMLVSVALPDWAKDCGVEGALLLPYEASSVQGADKGELWQNVDWFLAAFLMLEAWHERVWEHEHGPIHSYSYRLSGWDERLWQRAWVNRIGLFLRRWAARRQQNYEGVVFGPLPKTEILMTHDVDAVRKTVPIRLKQGAFNLFNAGRVLGKSDLKGAASHLRQAGRFLIGQDDWWTFDRLLADERRIDIKSVFHFYADSRPKTPKRWLFDPGYDVNQPALRELLRKLLANGHQIGLHPSFDSWQSDRDIVKQRERLQAAAGTEVRHCRQHWLRFSWKETWAAQTAAGLKYDSTLMFNDCPGFRVAAAINWQPWETGAERVHAITAQPSVLMDSHCYDYRSLDSVARQKEIHYWLDECRAVRGKIAVLWHPHTLAADYAWGEGFQQTLAEI